MGAVAEPEEESAEKRESEGEEVEESGQGAPADHEDPGSDPHPRDETPDYQTPPTHHVQVRYF